MLVKKNVLDNGAIFFIFLLRCFFFIYFSSFFVIKFKYENNCHSVSLKKTGTVECENLMKVVLFFIALALFSTISYALPTFNLATSLNQNTFYTMPLVPAIPLDYSYSTSDITGQLQTQAQVDVIIGSTTEPWFDSTYIHRRKITSSFTPQLNKTIDIIVNTKQLIDDGLLRSDCGDLLLVSNQSTIIPFIIEDCNSASTLLRLKSSDNSFYNLWMYYGKSNPSSSGVPVSAYKFYDGFSDTSHWNVGVGSVSISSGQLQSAENRTTMNLTSAQLSRDSELHFKFNSEVGSNMTLFLANPTNISFVNLALTFYSSTNSLSVCLNQGSSHSCSTYDVQIGTTTHSVLLDISSDGTTDIYVDDEKINSYARFTPSSMSLIAFEFQGISNLDDLSLLERFSGSSSFSFGNEQTLYHRYSGTAVGGVYGFTMPTLGIDSNDFSIVTIAKRTGYEDSKSVLLFSTLYNKLIFSLNEEGIVDSFDNRYVVNVEGELKIENNNNVPLDLDLKINSPFVIEEVGGSRITSDKIAVTIPAMSEVTIPYMSTGIITTNPASSNGVLATVLADFNDAYYEFGTLSFDKKEIFFAKEKPAESIEEEYKKTFNYFVNGTFVFDKYSLLIVTKKLSKSIVEKNDIISVNIKINNFDPFSRFVDVVDVIPEDFVLIQNGHDIPETTVVNWSFKMNKETSRDVSYQMRYIGNSTGHILLPKVNVTSGRLRQFSNSVSIIRKQKETEKLFITKIIESWNGEGYEDYKDVVQVTLSVANPTQKSFSNLFLDDMPDSSGVLFLAPSIPTFYTGRWTIDSLVPGQVWRTTYLTNKRSSLHSKPTISSFSNDVNFESVVVEKDDAPVDLYDVKYSIFSTGYAAIFILLLDIGIVSLYVYRNPLYGDDGEKMSFHRFIEKTNEWYVEQKVKRAKQKIFKQLEKERDMSRIHLNELKKQSGLLLSFFRLRAVKYYSERNMSIIGDAIGNFFGTIFQWIKDVASISGGDWRKMAVIFSKFAFYYVVIYPIRWIKNMSTYSIFLLGAFLLDKNSSSKLGRILSFSAKVLNPNLKEFVYGQVDKKAARKQEMYRREIHEIFKDKFKKIKKHSRVRSDDSYLPFPDRVKSFFKKIFKH